MQALSAKHAVLFIEQFQLEDFDLHFHGEQSRKTSQRDALTDSPRAIAKASARIVNLECLAKVDAELRVILAHFREPFVISDMIFAGFVLQI